MSIFLYLLFYFQFLVIGGIIGAIAITAIVVGVVLGTRSSESECSRKLFLILILYLSIKNK